LAVFGKLKIENNSFLKRWEKEIYKLIIDEVKKMVR